MTKQPETGHAKNLASLYDLNQHIKTLGVTYNASIATITALALETLYTNAKAKLEDVKTAFDTWKVATNQREIAFEALNAFATRLMGYLQSTGAPQQTLDDMAALVMKIRGGTRTPKLEAAKAADGSAPATEPAITRSSAQQSYDQLLEHFSKIVLLLKGVADYAPNEEELSIAGLEKRLADLTALNNGVSVAKANLKAARISRNAFFYAANTGVLDLVKKAKAYMLSIYGRTSQQYMAAIAIKFTRVIQKREAK